MFQECWRSCCFILVVLFVSSTRQLDSLSHGTVSKEQHNFQNGDEKSMVVLPQDCTEMCDETGCLFYCPQPPKTIKRCVTRSINKRLCCTADGPIAQPPSPRQVLASEYRGLRPALGTAAPKLFPIRNAGRVPMNPDAKAEMRLTLDKLKSLLQLRRKELAKTRNPPSAKTSRLVEGDKLNGDIKATKQSIDSLHSSFSKSSPYVPQNETKEYILLPSYSSENIEDDVALEHHNQETSYSSASAEGGVTLHLHKHQTVPNHNSNHENNQSDKTDLSQNEISHTELSRQPEIIQRTTLSSSNEAKPHKNISSQDKLNHELPNNEPENRKENDIVSTNIPKNSGAKSSEIQNNKDATTKPNSSTQQETSSNLKSDENNQSDKTDLSLNGDKVSDTELSKQTEIIQSSTLSSSNEAKPDKNISSKDKLNQELSNNESENRIENSIISTNIQKSSENNKDTATKQYLSSQQETSSNLSSNPTMKNVNEESDETSKPALLSKENSGSDVINHELSKFSQMAHNQELSVSNEQNYELHESKSENKNGTENTSTNIPKNSEDKGLPKDSIAANRHTSSNNNSNPTITNVNLKSTKGNNISRETPIDDKFTDAINSELSRLQGQITINIVKDDMPSNQNGNIIIPTNSPENSEAVVDTSQPYNNSEHHHNVTEHGQGKQNEEAIEYATEDQTAARITKLIALSQILPERNKIPSGPDSINDTLHAQKDYIALDKSIAENHDNIKPLESDIKPLEAAYKSLESGINALESDIKPLESGIKPLESDIKPLESGIKPLESNIKPLEYGIKPLEAGINALESGIKPLEWSTTSSESNIDSGRKLSKSIVGPEIRSENINSLSTTTEKVKFNNSVIIPLPDLLFFNNKSHGENVQLKNGTTLGDISIEMKSAKHVENNTSGSFRGSLMENTTNVNSQDVNQNENSNIYVNENALDTNGTMNIEMSKMSNVDQNQVLMSSMGGKNDHMLDEQNVFVPFNKSGQTIGNEMENNNDISKQTDKDRELYSENKEEAVVQKEVNRIVSDNGSKNTQQNSVQEYENLKVISENGRKQSEDDAFSSTVQTSPNGEIDGNAFFGSKSVSHPNAERESPKKSSEGHETNTELDEELTKRLQNPELYSSNEQKYIKNAVSQSELNSDKPNTSSENQENNFIIPTSNPESVEDTSTLSSENFSGANTIVDPDFRSSKGYGKSGTSIEDSINDVINEVIHTSPIGKPGQSYSNYQTKQTDMGTENIQLSQSDGKTTLNSDISSKEKVVKLVNSGQVSLSEDDEFQNESGEEEDTTPSSSTIYQESPTSQEGGELSTQPSTSNNANGNALGINKEKPKSPQQLQNTELTSINVEDIANRTKSETKAVNGQIFSVKETGGNDVMTENELKDPVSNRYQTSVLPELNITNFNDNGNALTSQRLNRELSEEEKDSIVKEEKVQIPEVQNNSGETKDATLPTIEYYQVPPNNNDLIPLSLTLDMNYSKSINGTGSEGQEETIVLDRSSVPQSTKEIKLLLDLYPSSEKEHNETNNGQNSIHLGELVVPEKKQNENFSRLTEIADNSTHYDALEKGIEHTNPERGSVNVTLNISVDTKDYTKNGTGEEDSDNISDLKHLNIEQAQGENKLNKHNERNAKKQHDYSLTALFQNKKDFGKWIEDSVNHTKPEDSFKKKGTKSYSYNFQDRFTPFTNVDDVQYDPFEISQPEIDYGKYSLYHKTPDVVENIEEKADISKIASNVKHEPHGEYFILNHEGQHLDDIYNSSFRGSYHREFDFGGRNYGKIERSSTNEGAKRNISPTKTFLESIKAISTTEQPSRAETVQQLSEDLTHVAIPNVDYGIESNSSRSNDLTEGEIFIISDENNKLFGQKNSKIQNLTKVMVTGSDNLGDLKNSKFPRDSEVKKNRLYKIKDTHEMSEPTVDRNLTESYLLDHQSNSSSQLGLRRVTDETTKTETGIDNHFNIAANYDSENELFAGNTSRTSAHDGILTSYEDNKEQQEVLTNISSDLNGHSSQSYGEIQENINSEPEENNILPKMVYNVEIRSSKEKGIDDLPSKSEMNNKINENIIRKYNLNLAMIGNNDLVETMKYSQNAGNTLHKSSDDAENSKGQREVSLTSNEKNKVLNPSSIFRKIMPDFVIADLLLPERTRQDNEKQYIKTKIPISVNINKNKSVDHKSRNHAKPLREQLPLSKAKGASLFKNIKNNVHKANETNLTNVPPGNLLNVYKLLGLQNFINSKSEEDEKEVAFRNKEQSRRHHKGARSGVPKCSCSPNARNVEPSATVPDSLDKLIQRQSPIYIFLGGNYTLNLTGKHAIVSGENPVGNNGLFAPNINIIKPTNTHDMNGEYLSLGHNNMNKEQEKFKNKQAETISMAGRNDDPNYTIVQKRANEDDEEPLDFTEHPNIQDPVDQTERKLEEISTNDLNRYSSEERQNGETNYSPPMENVKTVNENPRPDSSEAPLDGDNYIKSTTLENVKIDEQVIKRDSWESDSKASDINVGTDNRSLEPRQKNGNGLEPTEISTTPKTFQNNFQENVRYYPVPTYIYVRTT